MRKTSTIIGAGIQGCLVALQMERLGYEVNLVDKMDDVFMGASLNQEGKVHMGMVYALDDTDATPAKMIEDSMMFSPILEELTGQEIDWKSMQSTPFLYPVHVDSLCSIDELETRYQRYAELFRELSRNESCNYLGESRLEYFKPVELPSILDTSYFQGCFLSSERAVNPAELRKLIIKSIHAKERIKVFSGSEVTGVQRKSYGFETIFRKGVENRNLPSDVVVNASWESKRKIDLLLGIQSADSWLVRFKLGFTVQPRTYSDLRSFTIVQGPFGDFVNFDNQRSCYLSWYPCCKVGDTSEVNIPDSWQEMMMGNWNSIELDLIKEDTIRAFKRLAPALNIEKIIDVKGGTIVAYGEKDIDSVESGLHQRFETPVTFDDGYISFHTSKFTSAPNNVRRMMKLL